MSYAISGLVEVKGINVHHATQKAKHFAKVHETVHEWADKQFREEWKNTDWKFRFVTYLKSYPEGYYKEYYTIYYKYYYKVIPRNYKHLKYYLEHYINNNTTAMNEVIKLFSGITNKYLLTPDQAQFVKDFKDIVLLEDVETTMGVNSYL